MAEIKKDFRHSIMNKDLNVKLVPDGEYTDAQNIRVSKSEGQNAGVLENVIGNHAVSTFGDVTAVCIGAKKDPQRDVIYYFVKGSKEDSLIEYDENTEATRRILRDNKGILNFSVDHLITGIDLIGTGDERLLFWTDNYNPPRKINIERMFSITQGQIGADEPLFTEQEISVVKRPPLYPPIAQAKDINALDEETREEIERKENLKEKFPRFAYRWKYEDNEFSVFSPFTEAIFDPQNFRLNLDTGEIASMENSIRAIDLRFDTGPREVTDVELLYKESGSNTVYVVESFNKEKENWGDNIVLGEIVEYQFEVTDVSTLQYPLPSKARTTDTFDSVVLVDEDDNRTTISASTYQLVVGVGSDEDVIEFTTAPSWSEGDTVEIRYNTIAQPIEFSSNKLYRALPPDQLTRVFDNVPLTAKAQAIADNRIIYGNYTDKYDLDAVLETFEVNDGIQEVASTRREKIVVDIEASLTTSDEDAIPIVGGVAEASLKSDRDYELGIVYMDNVGRQTPVLTSENNSVNIPVNRSNVKNEISVRINSRAPQFATNYRFFIKETRGVHYSIIPLEVARNRFDDAEIWFRIAPTDLDKVNVGDYMSVKTADGQVIKNKSIVRIEELGQRPSNFLETEPFEREIDFDPEANSGDGNYDEHITSPIIEYQRAGVWMRLTHERGSDAEQAITNSFSGSDESVHERQTTAQNNAYSSISRGEPITSPSSYIDNTYMYPSVNHEEEDPDEEDITISGTYTRPNSHIGPTRFEIEITDTSKFKWYYYQAQEDNRIRRIAGNLGVEQDITPGTAFSLMFQDSSDDTAVDSGLDITFASGFGSDDWTVDDRFCFIARHEDNFSWNYIDWEGNTRSSRNNTNPNNAQHRQYAGRTCNAVLNMTEIATVNEGATFQIGIKDDIATNNTTSHPVVMNYARNKFTATDSYANIEEMMFEEGMYAQDVSRPGGGTGQNIEGSAGGSRGNYENPVNMSRFGFWRGEVRKREVEHGSFGIFRGKLRTRNQIVPDSDETDLKRQPLHLIFTGGRIGDTPNPDDPDPRIETEWTFNQGYGPSFDEPQEIRIVLETIPEESNLDVYYEIGDTFKCENGLHYGNESDNVQSIVNVIPEGEAGSETIDVTSIDLNLKYFNCFSYGNGVECMSIRDNVVKPFLDKGAKASVVYDEYEESNNYYSMIFSGRYNDATNYNGLNEFSSQLSALGQIIKQMNSFNGTIQLLYPENTNLYVFQEDKVNKVQVNKNVLFNADNTGNVTATREFLSQTVPIVGEYGISQNPESFAVWGGTKFWADKDRGVVLDMVNDQITEISQYGMIDYFRDNLATSNVIIGGYDDYHNQYILSMRDEFLDPSEELFNLPILLSRQSFLSKTSACRAVDSNLQFTKVYEFYTDTSPLEFEIGDLIYNDVDRTSIYKGENDWFVYKRSVEIPIYMEDIGQDPDNVDLRAPIFQVGYREWDDSTSYLEGEMVSYTTGVSRTYWAATADNNDSRPEFDNDDWVNIADDEVLAADEILVGQEMVITGPEDTAHTVEVASSGSILDDGRTTEFSITTDNDLFGEDIAINARFTAEIEFEYVINIDNFGVVRDKVNCTEVVPPNHDAFRLSLRGYHSAEEACAKGLVGRVAYHNGDDATPDVGDSIYDDPYGTDEYDDNGRYVKGRTVLSGWYQMFDGENLEDYVINIVKGKVINKVRCAAVSLGRFTVLLGDRVQRNDGENDAKLITRICANIPHEQRYYEGDSIVRPALGDRIFNDDFTSLRPAAGYYSMNDGYYIRINSEGFVIELDKCALEECYYKVVGLEEDEEAGDRDILNAQENKTGTFTFKGIYDEDIFGNDQANSASQITIRWNARGTERYPSNPDEFFTMTINNLTPDETFTLTDDDNRWNFDDTDETEVTYSIFSFCHYKTLVPQFIGIEYYNDDNPAIDGYPDDDVADFIARIYDTNGSLVSDPIEVQDPIYYDTSAAVRQYFTDNALTTELDGTQGITDTSLLDSVVINGETRYGLWWAFGDTDNSAADEGKLIDVNGYVLAERSAAHAFEHEVFFGTSRDLACANTTAMTVFADNPDFYDDADDATFVTSMVNSDGGYPIEGYYKGYSFDAEGNIDATWVRYWDGSAFDEEIFESDNCPVALANSKMLKYSTAEQTIVCGNGAENEYWYEGSATFGTSVTGIFTDEFGPNSIPASNLPSGFIGDGSNYYTWDGSTVTVNNTACTASAYCSISTACNYNANPGDNDYVDNSTCTYQTGVCRDVNASNYVANLSGCQVQDNSVCTYTYDCDDGTCVQAIGNNGEYSSLSACQSSCTPDCALSVGSLTQFASSGGTQNLTVTAPNCTPSGSILCIDSLSWTNIVSVNSVPDGLPTAQLTITASANSGDARSGTLTCTYAGASNVTTTISQAGGNLCADVNCGSNASCNESTGNCDCDDNYEYNDDGTCITTDVGSNSCVAIPVLQGTLGTGDSDSSSCSSESNSVFYGTYGGAAYTSASSCGTGFSGFISNGITYYEYSNGDSGTQTNCPGGKTCSGSFGSTSTTHTPFNTGINGWADGTVPTVTFTVNGAHKNSDGDFVGQCFCVSGAKTTINIVNTNINQKSGAISCETMLTFASDIPEGDSADSYVQCNVVSNLEGCSSLSDVETLSFEIYGGI